MPLCCFVDCIETATDVKNMGRYILYVCKKHFEELRLTPKTSEEFKD